MNHTAQEALAFASLWAQAAEANRKLGNNATAKVCTEEADRYARLAVQARETEDEERREAQRAEAEHYEHILKLWHY